MSTITPIHAPGAPPAIGPYSHGMVCNGTLVFLSGQIALDSSGAFVGGTCAEQTQQILCNIRLILASQGLSLQHVVKCTVFLQDMADYAAMNDVYAEAFAPHKPARSAVQVAGLPRQALVEIEVVACG